MTVGKQKIRGITADVISGKLEETEDDNSVAAIMPPSVVASVDIVDLKKIIDYAKSRGWI